jgi:PHD/YefM family antitoxin component YafN of YafNO toxin-antitoxin module
MRNHLKSYLDATVREDEVVYVARRDEENSVLLAEQKYNEMNQKINRLKAQLQFFKEMKKAEDAARDGGKWDSTEELLAELGIED